IRENFDQIHSEMDEFKPSEWVALDEHPDRWISQSKLETFEKNQKHEFEEDINSQLVSVNVSKMLEKSDVLTARVRGNIKNEDFRPLKLFISYAHEDENWRAKLAPNLNLLEREGLVDVWCDLQIRPGETWDEEIKRKMEESDLYLFLLSTHLL